MNRFLFFLLVFSRVTLFAQDPDFHFAKRLFDNKQYSAAQTVFQKILNYNKDPHSAYYNARCSKELFLSDAIDLYKNYQEDYPYSLYLDNVHEDLALIYFRKKSYSEALPYFEKINNIGSKNNLVFKLAYAYLSIDSLSDALYYFSKLMNIESKYASASRYYCAHIYYKQGLYRTALIHFNKLLNDAKFGKIVPYYISQIYFSEKEYAKLISFLEPIINNVMPSRSAEMNRLLAESYYFLKDYKNSIRYFNNYLQDEESPESIIHFFLGKSYFHLDDYNNAVDHLERVVFLEDSVMQNSTYYLAASYLNLNKNSYALQAFKKASSYDYNRLLKEDSYFNYAKLSYQLELPFDNTLKILQYYLENFSNPIYIKEIETLMVKTLEGTSQYLEAFNALKDIHLPNEDQKESIQKLAYF